ncbi:hypothetical protein MG293_012734 [Ovis ammon polii]|uniref:Contactin-5 n=3 Tax=Boreoeutheria TaxID=1437010 RepID=A0AAD4U3K6_OVIAM|nr:hypothetical protein MG293_012734 [Ovis ammon polii]
MLLNQMREKPTRIELTPKKTELTVGESIVLNCKAIHDPSLDVTFYWTLKGQPIDFEKEGGHFESIRAQASSADLMIRNILLMHAGRYGCRVQTTADSVSDEAELLVRGPPGPPGIVIVEEITESTATLSWSPAADNHSPISSYNLQARSPFSLGWQTVKTVPETITGDMESAMAVDLNPWVEYEFRVVATNPIGTGDPSTPSRMIRTNEAVPKTAPTNVSGRSGRRHELVIAWEPVSEEFQNGEGFGYIVAFRPNGTRGWKEKMVTSSEASKFIYRDESVPPLTPFEVKVGVYNNKGDGPFSQIVVICSAEGEPTAAPTDVKATSVSVSEILVAWKHIKESLGRPQGFEAVSTEEKESYRMSAIQNLHSFDPFADASKGDDLLPAGTEDYIHIRIQQRNGRKTLTTVQGIADDYDKKKLVKAFKKKFACNGTVIEHPEYGEVIQLQGDQRKNICQFLVEIGLAKDDQLKIGYRKDMEQEDAAETVKTRGNESSIILTGLEGNTLYHFTVRAYNGAGYGPPSSEVSAATKKSPPSQAPNNLRWEQQGSQLSLGWDPVRPLANESEVMGYKVFYRQEGHSNSQVIETQKPQAVVPLPDAGVYIIEVRAYGEGGDGTASSQIRVPSYSVSNIIPSTYQTEIQIKQSLQSFDLVECDKKC